MGKSYENSKDIADWAGRNNKESYADIIRHIANTLPKDYGTMKQRKILACDMLPEVQELSVVDKCIVADVSRPYWYQFTGSDEYRDLSIMVARRIKGKYAAGVMTRFIRNAMVGGKEGDGDTKAQIEFLKDIDLLRPDRHEHAIDLTNMSSDELRLLLGQIFGVTGPAEGVGPSSSRRTQEPS